MQHTIDIRIQCGKGKTSREKESIWFIVAFLKVGIELFKSSYDSHKTSMTKLIITKLMIVQSKTRRVVNE